MDSGIIKYFFGTPSTSLFSAKNGIFSINEGTPSAPLFSAKNRIFSINKGPVGAMVPPKHKNRKVTAKLHRNSYTHSIANFIEPPYNAL